MRVDLRFGVRSRFAVRLESSRHIVFSSELRGLTSSRSVILILLGGFIGWLFGAASANSTSPNTLSTLYEQPLLHKMGLGAPILGETTTFSVGPSVPTLQGLQLLSLRPPWMRPSALIPGFQE